ncbi:hypothetical protein ACFQVA_41045 [Actinomadura keratinilytica]
MPGVTGIVSLLALDEGTLPGRTSLSGGLAAHLALVQALTADGRSTSAPLWCATRGAVSTAPFDRAASLVQATTWGFGRALALEQPQEWGGLVDLPEEFNQRAGSRSSPSSPGPPGRTRWPSVPPASSPAAWSVPGSARMRSHHGSPPAPSW